MLLELFFFLPAEFFFLLLLGLNVGFLVVKLVLMVLVRGLDELNLFTVRTKD